MIVRIIAIRYDDCYIVSKPYEMKNISLAEINLVVGKDTIFDEFLVINDKLQETRIFNRVKTLKDEEEE